MKLFKILRYHVESEFGDIGGPKLMLVDWESAVHKALRKVFPECRIRACNFHFNQAIVRYAQKNGLPNISSDPDLSNWKGEIQGKILI